MNDDQISNKITGYLDLGTAGLRPGTAYKLQLARQEALARLSAPEVASQLTLAGTGGGNMSGGLSGRAPRIRDARIWIGVLLIVASVLYYQYWQSAKQARDIEETDTAILSSDLPIEAYLDRGFRNWLAHSEP
jgi:hypothetical protein